ncbi:MAG: hypothetical protein HRU19_29155 [Pseudobacteriovorax sp.]|nr:hypothetical protein [Pseudobacteriovorax sp.]
MKFFKGTMLILALATSSTNLMGRTTSGTSQGKIEYINCQNGNTQQGVQANVFHCSVKTSGVANNPCTGMPSSLFNLVVSGDGASPHAEQMLSVALYAYSSNKPVYLYYYNDKCKNGASQIMEMSGILISE